MDDTGLVRGGIRDCASESGARHHATRDNVGIRRNRALAVIKFECIPQFRAQNTLGNGFGNISVTGAAHRAKSLKNWRASQNKTTNTYVIEIPI